MILKKVLLTKIKTKIYYYFTSFNILKMGFLTALKTNKMKNKNNKNINITYVYNHSIIYEYNQ